MLHPRIVMRFGRGLVLPADEQNAAVGEQGRVHAAMCEARVRPVLIQAGVAGLHGVMRLDHLSPGMAE